MDADVLLDTPLLDRSLGLLHLEPLATQHGASPQLAALAAPQLTLAAVL